MSYRLLIKIAALASTCWLSVSAALAENRLALVIGNSSYSAVTALPNPANDAKAMTKFLASAGFQVLQAPNLTQSDMRKTISNFASMVAEKGSDTVALVFYAGHGLQVDGENYLIPVDANIQREADVPLQSMRLVDLMNALSSVPSRTRIVILDACRNNPFSEINKTTGRGLAIVDAPTGSLVSYSTAPGTEAQDGDGANSPYTTALLKIGQEPGLPIEQALKRVRLAVNDATNRQQTPWESSSLTSEFSFFATGGAKATMPSPGQPGTAANPRSESRSVESWQKELKSRTPRDAYEIVIREDKVEAYQAYLTLYPSQSLAPVVRTLVDRRLQMIAWYETVTVNTVAAYQNFLASYPGSDLAATVNRLIERARTRSVANAMSAFASAGPTCPCSQPTPAPRQKRADVAPAGNPASGPNNPSGPVTSYDPPVRVYTDPVVTPPVVTPPVRVVTPLPPHIPLPPRGTDKPGTDKPGTDKPGTDKPGTDKPGTDKPGSTQTGGSSDRPSRGYDKPVVNKPQLTGVRTNPKLTKVRLNDTPRIRNYGSSGASVRSLDKPKWDKPMRTHVTSGLATRNVTLNRGMMLGRGMSMGPRPMFRAGMMGGRRFF